MASQMFPIYFATAWLDLMFLPILSGTNTRAERSIYSSDITNKETYKAALASQSAWSSYMYEGSRGI